MSNNTDTKKIGDMGERKASKLLTEKGFEIVERNYHSRYGEIDIIASNDKYIVFAEVKTRNISSIARPCEWVDKKNQKKIITTALLYLQNNKTDLQPRFDIIEVEYDRITSVIVNIIHIENAFDCGGYYS